MCTTRLVSANPPPPVRLVSPPTPPPARALLARQPPPPRASLAPNPPRAHRPGIGRQCCPSPPLAFSGQYYGLAAAGPGGREGEPGHASAGIPLSDMPYGSIGLGNCVAFSPRTCSGDVPATCSGGVLVCNTEHSQSVAGTLLEQVIGRSPEHIFLLSSL